jgi:hypothetical protein
MTSRREFFRTLAAGSFGAALLPAFVRESMAQTPDKPKPATNIADAMKHPRTAESMPGRFPGKVVQVNHDSCVDAGKINPAAAAAMLAKGMLTLTGAKTVSDAWRMFVEPKHFVGLKVNPVAGPTLSTSHEVTQAVIDQLVEAGIPKKQIVLWDRREFELHEAGFTAEKYPGITIIGTERKDADGKFYDKDGRLYGEAMIDKNWSYHADVEETYDADTLPYMINQGKESYFSSIVTKQVDRIINLPILKNAGPSITLCLKNLAYGSISNTGRLHKELWAETSAQVCAFPPLRDKTVLNIVDGIRGCYNGGPAAEAKFFCDYKMLLLGTDPVALGQAGYEIVLRKRLDEKVQKEELPKARRPMILAEELKLGIADPAKITRSVVSCS